MRTAHVRYCTGVNWNDLQYLLAAYRSGTLAAAARELGCEHTTVSRRLAALEAALGTRLFTRTPEGLTPTPAADELVPLAEQIERQMLTMERRAAAHEARIEGTVRVTASETFAAFVIMRLVELRARHPNIVVEVIADNRALDLTRGEADLALRFTETTQQDLLVKKLGDVHWAMYASKVYLAERGAPSPIHSLVGHDVVGFDATLAAVPGAQWLAEHGTGASIVFRGNSLRAVLDATLAGMGVTVLPCQMCQREQHLQRVSAEVLGSRTLSLVVHPDLANVARVRAVMDFLAEIMKRDGALLRG
jgi:DNA-binding transcriptional LysR family regulator